MFDTDVGPNWHLRFRLKLEKLQKENEYLKMKNRLLTRDAGDILHQESLNISADMYSDELTVTLTNLGKQTMLKVLPKIFENKTLSKKQDLNKVTYAKKFKSVDRKINFNNSTNEVYNHIRAHGPKPGSWFVYKGERIKILRAVKKKDKGQQSTILNNKFMLACSDGSILPTLIQREGKKAVEVKDFIQGFAFTVNDKIHVYLQDYC